MASVPPYRLRTFGLLAIFVVAATALAACGDDANTNTSETVDSATETSSDGESVAPEADDTDDTDNTNEAANTGDTVSDDSSDPAPEPIDDNFPEVTGVEAEPAGDGTWGFAVTISSPYETSERYVDAWRVTDESGNQLGIRELAHGHPDEQPFTRSLDGVVIPDGVETVVVEGRDNANGWGGVTFKYALPTGSSY